MTGMTGSTGPKFDLPADSDGRTFRAVFVLATENQVC